jgi:hypothetical protein
MHGVCLEHDLKKLKSVGRFGRTYCLLALRAGTSG